MTFALNPASYADPDLAIAASRAGAVGMLNAEFSTDTAWIEPSLERLARYGGAAIGLKLTRIDDAVAGLANGFKDRLGYVVVDLSAARVGGAAMAGFRDAGAKLGVEVTEWSDEIAALCAGAGADFLWLKGNEAGGWVGEQTSFILLQKIAGRTALPVFVRGGVNERSAAAARVGGASGVVLDDQLLLLRESPFAASLAPKLQHFTGVETILLEQNGHGPSLRIWPVPGRPQARALAAEIRAAGGGIAAAHVAKIGWDADAALIPPLGQDGAMAAAWAARYGSVAVALRAIKAAVAELPAKAGSLGLHAPGAPLARAHGTRYPIVQGPMTHVSDRVDFIEAVAAGGALPMVAVSLMRGEALRALLRETRERLGDRPWGVGMLGFVPAEVLKEQRAAVREARPAFAIIAGGRPDQSRELEAAGVRTYLHVPSPALLAQFLEQGARHFIFEGRECGGHIGPLSSFVLWGLMTDALVACGLTDAERRKIHVLFAGGIHDARSSAMAAVMAAPLAECGIRSGILMGTGYTFTEEAVTGTAITPEFQRIVVAANETVGLVTGPGHASRCVVTPFVQAFWARGRALETAGASAEEVRAELDELSLGRLRLASKGVIRKQADRSELREAPVEEQREGGMFMIGQAAVLRDRPTTVAALHHAVGEAAEALLQDAVRHEATSTAAAAPPPADIAIVGMSAVFPGAPDLQRYWENILGKVCSIGEIPAERWDVQPYFDADRTAPDKIYSRWGGFIADVAFDPTRFGMPPVSLGAIDPMQLLALVAVEAALDDAGMTKMEPEQRALTSVILGITGGLGEMGLQYGARAELARSAGDSPADWGALLPEWTSDSFAGLLPNVAAGRVANRFDFGGSNFTVDAACASSLAALRQGMLELETGRSNVVLCGGLDTSQGPFMFTCFSKAQALSPTGQVRTFDNQADGTTISEGIAMVVLKRLEDAERDGDRVYAVIKGMGGSSDGRALGLMAPLPAGQKRALGRAYAQAGYSPATVEMFEAHGTGTVAGDAAELRSLSEFLREHDARPRQSAVGSVKTMIGHTKGSAGMAGLIKVALGLYHRVLPPHMGVEQPNLLLRETDSPLGLHQQARPWLTQPGHPRRAGVSSFGFGGTNFHVAMEEYQREYRAASRPAPRAAWPAELFVWRAADRDALIAATGPVLSVLEAGAAPDLAALAQALAAALPQGRASLAIVAESETALRTRLTVAVGLLRDPTNAKSFPEGVYFSDTPLAAEGKVAMLFSGQGSQYPDMLREATVAFDEMREALEAADTVLADTPTYRDRPDPRLTPLIYPFDRFGKAEEDAARAALSATDTAQPALGAVGVGLLALVRNLGLRADMVGGHSYGEYVALYAAGVLSRRDLLRASEARGRFIVGAAREGDLGTMAAVSAEVGAIREALDGSDVVLANFNAPRQTIISGSSAAIKAAIARLAAKGLSATPIPVAAAFHSPLMQPAQEPLAAFFAELHWSAPQVPVYANTTAIPHVAEPEQIRELLGRHLTEPVRFVDMVEAMYRADARVFLEIGPKSVLADLTRRILGKRPHRAVSFDGAGGGLTGMLHALAALVVEGVPCHLDRLFRGRVGAPVDLAKLASLRAGDAIGPHTWLVNGTRARRAGLPIQALPKRISAPVAERLPLPAASPPTTQTTAASVDVSHANGARPGKETIMDGYDGPARGNGAPDMSPPTADPPMLGADRTMAEYYQTMRQFLQVQERLMLAYLGGGAVQAPRPFSTPQFAAAPRYALGVPPRPAMNGHDPAAAMAQPVPVQAAPPLAAVVVPPRPASVVAPVAAPAPSRPAAVPVATAAPAADPKALLLQVASDRTGYPPDMLGLDLNMEADLGIDSIKRVEILGAFRKMLPAAVSEALSERMDDLSKAKSLQSILDLVAVGAGATPRPFELAGKGSAATPAVLSRPPVFDAPTIGVPLARYVIQPFADPLPVGRQAMVPGGIYVVIPDRLGVAAILSSALERDGARVRMMPDAALASEDATGKWLGTVRFEDRIRGVVDLRPLRRSGGIDWADLDAWRGAMQSDIKALFPVLRLSATDLASGGSILVASGMGGTFARDATGAAGEPKLSPGAGGGVGLIKCLSFEWPDCHGKAVDLDPNQPIERLAEQLHAELALPGGRREVGYPHGIRTIFRTEPASLIPVAVPTQAPDEDWVVLAVGGARGITAETLREFAAVGATCVIVGRAATPGPADPVTQALPDAAALRGFFLRQAKDAGDQPRPAAIEARIAAVLRDREIRANLADFAAMGARVDTRVCDVRQEADVAAMLASVYERYGRIDAVIFGAGLIEDQLLVNKTADSLSRVFDTKVDGAYLVARGLRTESLKFFALFTSVAGRYGNRGQTDYGAANEVLNRFAWVLQAKWGTGVKVSAINWGPWANTTNGPGMLTPETARQFRERGVNLVEPEGGRGFLLRELLYAPRDEVEVVAGEYPWEYMEAAAARGAAAAIVPIAPPLLHTAVTEAANGNGRILRKTIDLVSDPYLDEHRIDGMPVMPIAVAAEYMAEAASVLGGAPVSAVTGVRRLNGILLRGRSVEVEVVCRPSPDGLSAEMEITQTKPERRAAYRGTVEFGAPTACGGSVVLSRPVEPAPRDVGDIYRRLMFHGPKFQTIRDIVTMSRDRIVASGVATRPTDFYPPAAGQNWLFDPGLVDGAMQLVFMWSCQFRDAASLPSALGRMTRYGDEPLSGDVTLAIEIQEGWKDSLIRWRLDVLDAEGRTRLAIDDCEFWLDPKLNRLHGGWSGGVPADRQRHPAEA